MSEGQPDVKTKIYERGYMSNESNTDPSESSGGMSVTIKFPESEKFAADNPWIVFHGSVARVRADLIATFGLTPNDELTVSDLALEAQSIASATGKLAKQTGARTLRSTTGAGKPAGKPAESKPEGTPAWEDKTETPAEPEAPVVDPLIAEIEAITTQAEHKNMWADNKAALQANPDAIEAWKNKGRALRDAA